ncbi:MAG: hypothetical protein ABIQ79_03140 [Nitrospiraceae bacterium]
MLADGDQVLISKLTARDRLAIDGGAVGALQVFEKEDGLNFHNPCMMPRDGGIFDRKGIVGFPTDRQCLMDEVDVLRALPVKF